jgi:hypothetical protein
MRPTLLALFAACLVPFAMLSQIGTEGSFFGTVTDATGAVVPNAGVTVTNIDTKFTRMVTTSQDGNFDILSLPIGPYSILVSAKGFKKWELARTDLNVGDRDRISPVLEVGQLSETVSVSTTSEVLQTETAATQTVVQMQQIRELPLDTRNPLALVALVPGMRLDSVQNGGERSTYMQGQGLRNNKTAFQLDGINSNAPMDEGGTAMPNVDTVAEFNVQATSFTAESGRDPMQVLVVMKSGTNTFHGSAWEFVQNDIFNARNTFALTKNRVRYNQFGATLGGPIIRNKTFFFASFQGTETRNATVYNSLAVTPAMETGNFGSLKKTIVNPFANNAPFPNNQIPASLINPASKYFLPYILQPNSPDGYFRANASALNNTWEGDARVDHQINPSQRIYGRFVTVRQPQTVLGYNPSSSITGNDEVTQNSIGLNYTWTISPQTLLIASAGTMRTRNAYSNPNLGKKNDDELAGIQGFPTAGREAWIGPPDISFGSGYTGVSFPGGWGVPGALWGNVYNGKVGINQILGSHTLAGGFEYGDWHTYGEHGSQAPRGQFYFNNLYTNDGFADYLLGLTSSSYRNDPLTTFGSDRAPYTGYYIQDSWRAHPNLTFNFGVRYEHWLAHHNVGDVSSTWDPDRGIVVTAVNSSGQPNLKAFPVTPYLAAATQGLWTTARNVSYPDGLYFANGNWAPRLGVVYRPFSSKSVVVRAGYGIYYNSYTGNRGGSTINVPHWSLESKTISPTTLQNWQTLWPSNPSSFASFQIYAPLGNIRPARTHEWNISVQTALPLKTALTLSYVGTRVGNEVGAQQDNEASIGLHSNIQADRPYPAYSGIQVYQNLGSNWYNALQTKLERRFADGLSFSFSYSFSRNMADNLPNCETCSLVPYSPAWYNRGRTAFDYRHIEYATLVWQLPVGKGKRYGGAMNRGFEQIIGGWQLSLTQQAQSGAPLSIAGGTSNLGNGWGARANVIGNPGISNPSASVWFNTAAFEIPGLYTFGNSGIGILEGPGLLQVNTSLAKDFHITESKYFQFRWESYNLTNRVNYDGSNSSLDTTLTDSNFGKITKALPSRYMQFALKFIF